MIVFRYILSILLWFLFWFWTTIWVSTALILSFFLPPGIIEKIVQKICTFLCYIVLLFPRIRSKPENMIYPVIYVANHVSFFDLFLSSAVLDGYPRGFELASHFKKPVYGWFISRFGQVPIDPSNRRTLLRSFEVAANILRNKERNFFVMPEGTRTRTGKIGKFKYGAFLLAIRSGHPVVPVVYKNLYRHTNAHNILITPGFVDVLIGEPVYPDGFKNEKEYGEHVRNIMIKMEDHDT